MTIAQQLRQQGMQQGVQQGMHLKSSEIAKKMLLRGEDIQIIMNDTGLSVGEINALQNELDPATH